MRARLLREVALLTGLYAGYSVSRLLVSSPEAEAVQRARDVLALQQSLGLDVEQAAVELLLRSTALSVLAGYAYAALHYTVTPAVLVWLWRRHPSSYARARSALVLATVVALAAYWLWPTAPPRLLPGGSYPDVLALHAQWGWWGADASAPRGLGALTNEYAAMPSMHVGWALWCGVVVAVHARRRLVRVLAVAYPLLIGLVVVVTANHWVLDAVAGAAVVLLAARATRVGALDPAAASGTSVTAGRREEPAAPASSCRRRPGRDVRPICPRPAAPSLSVDTPGRRPAVATPREVRP